MMLFLLSVAMAQASAVPPETCKERKQPEMPVLSARDLGRGSVPAETIDSLPTAAAAELRRFFRTGGGIADADGPSNSADVVGNDVPTRRSLRAYHALNHWII